MNDNNLQHLADHERSLVYLLLTSTLNRRNRRFSLQQVCNNFISTVRHAQNCVLSMERPCQFYQILTASDSQDSGCLKLLQAHNRAIFEGRPIGSR